MRITLLQSITILVAMCANAGAADLRIYTRIYDKTKDINTPVARTLTVFHNGRVYDYIDSLDEVIVYEPAKKRFVVVNIKLRVKTVIGTDKVEELMEAARKVVRGQVAELRKKGDAPSLATAKMLAFQLKPKFRESYVMKSKQLALESNQLRYDVTLDTGQSKEAVAAYRDYADWVVRLNYVLYPRVVLPAARRVLNAKAAAEGGIPFRVERTLNTRPRLSARAEHEITKKLDRKDRSDLREWDAMLTSKTVRELSLRAYQRQMGIRSASK